MNTKLICGLLALLTAGVTRSQAAAPVNDSATKATAITGTYQAFPQQTLDTATAASTDPLINGQSAGKTLWYRRARMSFPWTGDFKMVIKSTTASGWACLYKQIDEENLLGGLVQNGLPVAITPGQTIELSRTNTAESYVMMVSGTGAFDLTHLGSRTTNDYPRTAKLLTQNKGTVEGSTAKASLSPDEPSRPAGASPVINTVWYKWVPTFTGSAAADTNFSLLYGNQDGLLQDSSDYNSHHTNLAVYAGSSPESLTFMAESSSGGWGSNSRILFNVTAGASYYIAVSTVPGFQPGGFELNYYPANSAGEFYLQEQFSKETNESAGGMFVEVRRRYAGNVSASVKLSTTADGNATAGSDFQALNTTLNFSNPSTPSEQAWSMKGFLVLLDDTVSEDSESVSLKLSNPSLGATISTEDSTIVRITDNDTDTSLYDSVSLQFPVLRVNESDKYAVNRLTRSQTPGNASYAIHQVPLASSTATYQTDYFLGGGTLGANDGFVDLNNAIVDDDEFEEDETVIVTIFGGWSYTIIIEDNDPFVPVAGRIMAALPYSYRGRQAQLIAAVSGTGAITGRLQLVDQALSVKGQLDWHGKATFNLAPKGRPGMVLLVQATNSHGGYRFTLTDGAAPDSKSVTAVLQNYSPVANPCPEAGRNTFVALDIPFGPGVNTTAVGSIVVDKSGNAQVAGRLFDGTPFTTTGYVDGDGSLSALSRVGTTLGCFGLHGDMPTSAGQSSLVTALVNRPARAGDSLKLVAVSNDYINAYICRYSPPASGQRALESWSAGTGKAELSKGALMTTITNVFSISTSNIITPTPSAEKLQLKLSASTGLFTGSALLPGKTKALPIYGALMDLPGMNGYGQGFFFDGLKAGTVKIGKP